LNFRILKNKPSIVDEIEHDLLKNKYLEVEEKRSRPKKNREFLLFGF